MTNYTDAIAILETGNEDSAWEIARCDSGLALSCTKERWLSFAYKAIEDSKQQTLANAYLADFN